MREQHYKRVSEKIPVYLYFLGGFFIMKVVENSPQNARNCIISKKISWGPCPQTSLTTARSFAARACISKFPPKIIVAPPLRNPAYAPEFTFYKELHITF